jgi:hypothetical protein
MISLRRPERVRVADAMSADAFAIATRCERHDVLVSPTGADLSYIQAYAENVSVTS